jgi:hypothetical protein
MPDATEPDRGKGEYVLNTNNAPERARWEVLWIKDKRIVRKSFGTDLMGATELYSKVKAAGRSGATLRCCNMGFPPPEELQPRRVKARKNGKIIEGLLVPMKRKNAEGIFYCPYCQQLRRFVKKKSSEIEGQIIRDLYFGCPLCGTSHRDHNARKWNPLLTKIAYEIEAEGTRAPKRTVKTRRAERRRKRRRDG